MSTRLDVIYSYLIIIKSLMPSVVASIFHDLTSPSINPPSWALSERLWLTFFMAILIPLSFLRQLDSLRHTSYVALFAVGVSSFCPLYRLILSSSSLSSYHRGDLLFLSIEGHARTGGCLTYPLFPEFYFDVPPSGLRFYMRPERELLHSVTSSKRRLTLVQIFPIYNELIDNSQERMNLVIGTSIGFSTTTYMIIAVFGYLTFGSNVVPPLFFNLLDV
jgi:amino acid permease